jgi:ketosteroid isomerase-like protein
MSTHKDVVARYFDGFRASDHELILSLLTDDVVWDLPGFKHCEGKAEFDAEIENPGFSGSPKLTVDRMVEEGDVVVTTGRGQGHTADGAEVHFAFSDVFELTGDLISRVESYVVPLTEPPV